MTDEQLTIKIRTMTPIWTGGVTGKCDRLYETGIIGSLRGWYEAVVRRLEGYACDPTAERRCKLSGKEKTDEERRKNMCLACYLFGCTGWKRRFWSHIEGAPITPLHFRTSVNLNKNWLKRVFGGESQNIDNLGVFYGDIMFKFILEKNDEDYIRSQLLMLFSFISKYGGLGAKLQHGFGQIQVLEPESIKDNETIKNGLEELRNRIQADEFFQGEKVNTPYNLENFVCLDYDLPRSSLTKFMQQGAHIGNNAKLQEEGYLPCAFDLKYKGKGNLGMRNWLENTKGWEHKNVNILMGVSQKKGEDLTDKDRAASRLCFGMPYKLSNDNYRLRIFGFAPPDILNPDELKALCKEYMHHAFGVKINPVKMNSGKEIIELVGGEQ